MKAFYPEGYWIKRETGIAGYYRNIIIYFELRKFRKLLKPGGRLLDVGSGNGEFLFHAATCGYDVYGVETSKDMVDYSIKTFGLKNVIHSDIFSASFDTASFDGVVFNHVFEHLYNPLETLDEARRILKKDGILAIQIPNIDSYQFKVFGKRWLGLSLPQHLYHFTPQTIRLAIEKGGFKILKIAHHSVRNSPVLASLSLAHLNLYKLYRREGNGKSVFFQKLLILLLSWALFPLTIVEGWLRKGGIITVFAKKVQ